jgi:methionyl-tRNA formyltransferase
LKPWKINKSMKIVFAGTPHFADSALQALLAAGFNVVAVFTQPDRPAGRGLKLTPSPVKQTALAHGIAVHQPRSLRLDGKYPDDAAAAQAALQALDADVMVVAAYGLILPQWVLDAPRAGCVNIHASLLPRWRGAAPIQRAIEAGDAESGVCLMQMDAGLDTGAIYAAQSLPIHAHTTGGDLLAQLSTLGAAMLVEHLPAIANQCLSAIAQPLDGISYAHKLQRSDGVLDFSKSAEELCLQIRAFDPVPGCSFEHLGETYKVWAATALPAPQMPATAGTVLAVSAAGVLIACGAGETASLLNVQTIQKAGGKRVAVHEAWQGLQGLLVKN